jgi:hypothetical protein
LITTNIHSLKEISSALGIEGMKMGLRIDEEKTKHKKMSPTRVKNILL